MNLYFNIFILYSYLSKGVSKINIADIVFEEKRTLYNQLKKGKKYLKCL